MKIKTIEVQKGSLVNIQPIRITYENGGVRALRDYEIMEFEWTYNFISNYVRDFENINGIQNLTFTNGKETVGLPANLISFFIENFNSCLRSIMNSDKIKMMKMLVRHCFEMKQEPNTLRLNMGIYSYVPRVAAPEPIVTSFEMN